MLLDLDDRQLQHARRGLNRGLLAWALAQQRGADRRLVRDLAIAWPRLGAADDSPGLVFVLAIDTDGDFGADPHLVAFAVLLIDELGAREDVLDLADAPFEMSLVVLGILVLTTLGDVAQFLGGA